MTKQYMCLSIVLLLFTCPGLHADDSVGPYVGTLKTTEAHLLYSPGHEATKLRLTVNNEQGTTVAAVDGRSESEHDFVAKFHVVGLSPGTTYRYQIEKIEDGNATLVAGGTPDFHFTTVSEHRSGQVLNAAFVSCVNDTTKPVPVLTVRFLDKDGQENLVRTITYDQLTPRPESGLATDLRAWWSFDGDTKNHSVLSDRLDGKLAGGATVTNQHGVRGGALQLNRAGSQYLTVPRAMLNDNASAYTASCWVKPAWLPAHGSKDRSFIMESNVTNHCELPEASGTGYAISLGLRACEEAQKINLQLYTETLVPQPVGSERSPDTRAQGGFDCLLDRSLFSDWTHVAVTFDSATLQLFVNGRLAMTHTLPISGPIAETGGLVIGGHRAGEGRNFDGMIDEVAIWNRVLSESDIGAIYNNGSPRTLHNN